MIPKIGRKIRLASLLTHTGSQKQLTRSIFPDTICSYILTVRLYNPLLAIVSESIGLVFWVVDSSLNNFVMSEPLWPSTYPFIQLENGIAGTKFRSVLKAQSLSCHFCVRLGNDTTS